ncbi:MAG: DEAD/DEAH box helicase [Planctomycetaceae bacterium]|jgi:SNF2 family DNA or RNA helicase|nr:DEAD/DEAH box helicase [Planctomycetaceae bacterium]
MLEAGVANNLRFGFAAGGETSGVLGLSSRRMEIDVIEVPLLLPELRVASLPVRQRMAIGLRSWFFDAPSDEVKQPDKSDPSVSAIDQIDKNQFDINQIDKNQIDKNQFIAEVGGGDGDVGEIIGGAVNVNVVNIDSVISGGVNESGESLFFSDPDKVTRIRTPRDVIKIEDRLNYILQPPIEAMLHLPTVEMPFEPFPYQRQGIAFLYSAEFAILADEMGLGKTMQAITTLRLLLRTGEVRTVLLICPKPLLTNWQREFALWAPEISVQIIDGSPARRKWLWQLPGIPVRIANYELLHRDREYFDVPREAGGLQFDLVILDESQRIKNRGNVTAQAARAIPRRRNWALTGTPIENSQEDLVGIFEFLAPGYLASGLRPTEVCNIVGEHILRRTKEKVLTDLPPKLVHDAMLELTAGQLETYKMAENDGVLRLTESGDCVTIPQVFELVMRLKQICNYDPATGESAKLERLEADIEEVAQSGRKAIIFSQWVETLMWLRGHLERFGVVEYHGSIPSRFRDEKIREFKEDKDKHVILMSYATGSVGLNLQFAEYVFLFDRWWNPAVEDQAINRAHRIGAAGPVTVTRFISVDTVEERIDRVLREKRELSELILSGARGFNMSTGLNQEDIFGLFNLKIPQKKKPAA